MVKKVKKDYDKAEKMLSKVLDGSKVEQLKATDLVVQKCGITKGNALDILDSLRKKVVPKIENIVAEEIEDETELDKEIKELLKTEKMKQLFTDLKKEKINWIEEKWFDSWEKIKSVSKKVWGHKKKAEEKTDLFLLGHDKDTIIGKPQLVEDVQRTILLIRKAISSVEEKKPVVVDNELKMKKEKIEIQSFYFLGENFDKRHDGFQKDTLALDFWLYKVKSKDKKEYFVWSQQELPNTTCTFKGMKVPLDDDAELSRSLKIKSISKLFFVRSFVPDVKILSKEEIIDFTQRREIEEEDWLSFLAYHPLLNSYNRFPKTTEYLKSAFILSGKYQGYPLHLSVIGIAGTKKSCGYIETTAYKFDEEPEICEGGNSRLKGLIPSFKDRPANMGHILEQDRLSCVDELGKMIDYELSKNNQGGSEIMGELNAILDHKPRMARSGNANVVMNATAKNLWVMNPLSQSPTIYAHVGRKINTTTMTRCLWWVQGEEEVRFSYGDSAVVSDNTYTSIQESEKYKNESNSNNEINEKRLKGLNGCWRKIKSREEFLTLFDTCYSFLSDIDLSESRKIADEITDLAQAQMKDVWKPRGEHHTTLLIDGLVKHRCLFKDYDSSFKAKEEDYELARTILKEMVKNWDTEFMVGGSR